MQPVASGARGGWLRSRVLGLELRSQRQDGATVLVFRDPRTGEEFDGELGESERLRRAAEERASAEAKRASAEAERRRAAEECASAEAERRRTAEERASAEAERRRAAEERASAEAKSRQAAEERARALEEQLRTLAADSPSPERKP